MPVTPQDRILAPSWLDSGIANFSDKVLKRYIRVDRSSLTISGVIPNSRYLRTVPKVLHRYDQAKIDSGPGHFIKFSRVLGGVLLLLCPLNAGGKLSLRRLFDDLVWKHFFDDVRLEEPGVTQYVSNMLVDFVDIGNLYRLQNTQGKRLEDVGEMLIESNPMLAAPSFDRERAVRKHVEDYTLFMTGLFPESVARSRQTKRPRPDAFVEACRPHLCPRMSYRDANFA